jgi:hypothetical protein
MRVWTLYGMVALIIALFTLACCLDRFATARTLLSDDPPGPQTLGGDSGPTGLRVWARFGEVPEESSVRLRARAVVRAAPAAPARGDIFLVPVTAAGQRVWDRVYRVRPIDRADGARVYRERAFLEAGFRGFELVAPIDDVESLDAELDLLAIRPFYRWMGPVLIVIWLGLGGATVVRCLRSVQRRGYALAALAVGAMFYAGTLMPARYVHAGTAVVKDAAEAFIGRSTGSLGRPTPSLGSPWPIEPEKLAHLSLAVALALFARRGFTGSLLTMSATLLGVVAATELLQVMTLDRDPSFRDVGIDAIGLSFGLAAALSLEARTRSAGAGLLRSAQSGSATRHSR